MAEVPDQGTIVQADTVCGAFQRAVRHGGDHVALRTRHDALSYTWSDYGDHVRRVAAGLAALGLRHGQTVAVQLATRPEFHFVDMGAVHLGAVPFGIYNTSTPAQIVERLANSDCQVFVTETAFLGVVEEAVEKFGGIEHVVVIDGDGTRYPDLRALEQMGDPDFDFDAAWNAVTPDDLVTVVYTSGTTGPPKGVQWSHDGIMTLLRSFGKRLPMPTRAVSYLPMAHAGERLLTHYMPIPLAATVTCCGNVREVLDDVRESHPDFLATVPRTWVKMRAAIEAQVEALEDGQRLRAAIDVGLRRATLDLNGEPVPDELATEHEAAKALLRTEILAGWGLDNMKVAIIGSAPPPQDVILYFLALGVPLLEAYGMTEAHGFGAVWPALDDFRIGTVGRPLEGVEVELADDGEILLRSRMNMVGYRKQQEETALTLDADGWLHSGDLGEIDADGFVTVVDRKKDIIISQAGKNMSPANIEAEIRKASMVIGQAVCVGDGRHYNVALLTVDTDGAAALARRHGLPDASVGAVVASDAVHAEIAAAVDEANRNLSRVEQIKKFRLLDVEWVPDSDELTPTMKLKRRQVLVKYKDVIDELYAGS